MPFAAKISAETVQEWVKRHACGETMSKIAAADDVHVSTVSRRIRAATPAQPPTPTEPLHQRAVDDPSAATAAPAAANAAQTASASDSSSPHASEHAPAAAIAIPAGARVHLYAPDGQWVASTNERDFERALDVHRRRGPLTISLDPPKPRRPRA